MGDATQTKRRLLRTAARYKEDNMTEIVAWFKANGKDLLDIAAYVCLTASVIVKLTPTQKDDALLLPVIKFIGKYLALDKYGPKER